MRNMNEILLPILAVIYAFSRPPTAVNATRILGLFAHPSESHFAVMRSVMLELARREYNVTVYSSHRLGEQVDNLQEFIVEPEFPFWSKLQTVAGMRGDLVKLSQLPAGSLQKSLASAGAAAVDYFMSHTVVQSLLHLPPDEFDYDLIIVDLFYTEALLALGHVHRKPTIGIVSTNFEHYMQHVQETMVPAACSPIDFETYSPLDGFWTRLANIRNCMARRKLFAKHNFAEQEALIKKHFAHFKGPAPTVPELYSNLAVLLRNNHVPLATPGPLLQNIIPAGGLHIRPPRELPWHIRRYLDEARSGVIYVNLGNEQLCGEVPKEVLKTLFTIFANGKERVLWTCHDVQTLKDLPKNVLIQHMVPQTDILAHPHVKVFVMNGDLLSLQEGIVRHVPMLGIPMFRNEIENMQLAERLGVGLKIDHANLTETSLTWALAALMHDGTYPIAIRQVSRVFRDRPLGALETCMYWVDYVLRHNGGDHLKTLGVGIPSNQLHLFDLFIFYFGASLLFVGVLLIAYYAMYLMWRQRQVQKMYSKLN